MTLVSPLLAAVLLVAAPADSKNPAWEKAELKSLLAKVIAAGHTANRDTWAQQIAPVIAHAYRTSPPSRESLDAFARRALSVRDPTHPAVRDGQWMQALCAVFYADLGARAELLARFESDKKDRVFFETNARESKTIAVQFAAQTEIRREGSDQTTALLAVADAPAAGKHGCEASVRNGRVTVKGLERITFVNDQPPGNAPRTAMGALVELVAAMKQYNLEAKTLGLVDANLKRGFGQIRLFVPGTFPALYINELARAAKEAGMHTLYLMVHRVHDKSLGELVFRLVPESKGSTKEEIAHKRPHAPAVEVHCPDAETVSACVSRTQELRRGRKMIYRAEPLRGAVD